MNLMKSFTLGAVVGLGVGMVLLALLMPFITDEVQAQAVVERYHTKQHTCYLITPQGGIVETRDEVCH